RLLEARFAHASGVLAIDLGADDGVVAVGTEDGTVYVLDYPQGNLLKKFRAHRGFVVDVRVLKSGVILSAGVDGAINSWAPADATPRLIGRAKASITALCVSGDATTVYVATTDASIEVWDLSKAMRTF